MDHDQKIGLALGVLLVGAAGAFFFRNESLVADAPALQTSREINNRIRQRPNAPYLVESNLPTAELSDSKKTDSVELPTQNPAVNPNIGRSNPPPDPIPYDADTASSPRASRDDRVARPSPIEHKVSDAPARAPAAAPPAKNATEPTGRDEDQFHTVQSGDTLSSISQQYYGTSARFADIYAANRDVLSDANTLRPNLRLRIPAFPGRAAEFISSRPLP